MRIGLLAPTFNVNHGGAATYEQELFGGLLTERRQFAHTLVIFSETPRPPDLPADQSVEWVQVRHRPVRHILAWGRKIINRTANRTLFLPSPFTHENWLDAYLDKHEIEFFLNLAPTNSVTSTPYLTPIWDLAVCSLTFLPECSHLGTWVRWEIKFEELIRKAAIITVGTQVGKNDLLRRYGIPENRVVVCPLPTPGFALEAGRASRAASAPAPAGSGEDYVFYPARFEVHKNHVTLLRAIAHLRDHHSLKLQLAFSGADWGNLGHVQSTVQKLGLEGQVRFHGFVSRDQLVALYQNALAMVFPTLLGPDNLPPLEAFALGCPVIASAIEGASEQLGKAALLFPPTDEVALAKAILHLQRDPATRKALVERGYARASAYTHRHLAGDLLRLIQEFEPIRRCWSVTNSYRRKYNFRWLLGR